MSASFIVNFSGAPSAYVQVIHETLIPWLLIPEESIPAASNISFNLHKRLLWQTGILKYQYLSSRNSFLAYNRKDPYALIIVEVMISRAQIG